MATLADVEVALKATLGGDATLATLATGGVFHLKAPQDTQAPYVLYACIDDGQDETFTTDVIAAVYTVTVVQQSRLDADEARAILDRCRTLLHRQDIATGSLVQCQCKAVGFGLLQADAESIVGTVDFEIKAE